MSIAKFDPASLPAPDEMGFFRHPDVPGEDESGDDMVTLIRKMGFEPALVSIRDDKPDLYEEWREDEECDVALRWVPMPPNGNGWIMAAKLDTNFGPYALFVRRAIQSSEAGRLQGVAGRGNDKDVRDGRKWDYRGFGQHPIIEKIEMRIGLPNARPIRSAHANMNIPGVLKSAVESVDAHGSGALVWLKQTHAARNRWKAFGHLLKSSRPA